MISSDGVGQRTTNRWRLAAAALLLVLVGIAVASVVQGRPAGTEPRAVEVADLDEDGCAAAGHAWTLRGCVTQDVAADEQARRAQFSREAEAARAQRKERTRLEKQGWSTFDQGIGAEGLFYRPLTPAEYQSLADNRCTDSPCFAMLVRSDSVTDCSRGLTVRIDVMYDGTIIGSGATRVRHLPPSSQARFVIGLENGVDRGSRAEFTRLRCTPGS